MAKLLLLQSAWPGGGWAWDADSLSFLGGKSDGDLAGPGSP